MVKAFNEKGGSTYNTKGVKAKPSVSVPKVKAKSSGYNAVTVSWNKVAGANGYRIYRWNGKKWTQIKEIKKGNTLSCKITGLTCGTTYKYTVKAYRKVDGKRKFSGYSSGVSVKVIPSTPKVKAVASGKKTVKISWGKVTGASGYYVYRWNGKKWTKIKTISNGRTFSYKNSGLKKGKKYKYTVAAYRTVNKKKVVSAYNKTGVTVKVK